MTMWAMRGVIETTGPVDPDVWQCHLAVVMAGFRAEHLDLPVPPLDPGRFERAAGCSG